MRGDGSQRRFLCEREVEAAESLDDVSGFLKRCMFNLWGKTSCDWA